MIEFDHVSLTVDTESAPLTIVDDLHLTLAESSVAVIGPNGSGKSSVARMINGLVSPTVGTVRVNGLTVVDHARAVRDQVGFVFTDPAAQLVMPTAVEDVALSLRRTIRDKSARHRRATELLAEFSLAGLENRSVHVLSGGQRQLLALAGVLALNPAVVVADEPTTLLDLANSRHMGEVLLGLDQQLILVTHDLDLALRCDRAILIKHGKVIADGAPAEVVRHYREHP